MPNAREKAGRNADIPSDELGNRSLKQGLPDDNLPKRTRKKGDLLAEYRLIGVASLQAAALGGADRPSWRYSVASLLMFGITCGDGKAPGFASED